MNGFDTRLLIAFTGKKTSLPDSLNPRYSVNIGSSIMEYNKSRTREKPVLLIRIPTKRAKEKKVNISST